MMLRWRLTLVIVPVQDPLLVTAIAEITLVLDHAIRDAVVADTAVRDRDHLIVIIAGQDLLADDDTTTNCRRNGLQYLKRGYYIDK